jgi:hypothetical protein
MSRMSRRHSGTRSVGPPAVFLHKGAVLQAFPDLREKYEQAEKAIASPGCSSCKRKKQARILYQEVQNQVKTTKNVDFSALKEIFPEMWTKNVKKEGDDEILPSWRTSFSTPHGQNEDNSRVPCLDCVAKHVSQAYVLLKESLQGYEEHVELAQRRIRHAWEESSEQEKPALGEILVDLEAVDTSKTDSKCVWHILRAIEALHRMMESWSERMSVGAWIAIGHLGEAADECVGEFPLFADEIRRERLQLMQDPTYAIPLRHLLHQAKMLLGRTSDVQSNPNGDEPDTVRDAVEQPGEDNPGLS